jgi:3-phenylpropionate/cinnamic acid dioxygenase small subunit
VPPPRTAHIVANIEIDPDSDGNRRHRVVHSTVQVAESRPGVRIDWVGHTTHHLVEHDGELRIAFKKVVLVDNDQELTTLDFLL